MTTAITPDTLGDRIRRVVDNASATMTQAEVARRLGMDPSNLSKYLTGRLTPTRTLVNRLVVELGVSKQWLLDGEGPIYSEAPEAVPQRGTPVYDIDVTAGCHPLERMFTRDRITGYVDLPRVNPGSVIVRVSGDSMEPRIIDGGFIAIRPIKSVANIFWGQTYVIVMEEYRMVKVLRRHPSDPSMVILHSENPAYDDMDVSRADIQALFLVESVLNFKSLC